MALFKTKIRPLPCPFLSFWRFGRLCLQHLRISRGDGWKSASERPTWSAFNGLEGKKKKAREEGTVPFSFHFFFPPLLGRVECCFWSFLSGVILGADFFFFWFFPPWLLFVVTELFLWPRPPLFSLGPDLFDVSQTKWRILSVWRKQRISERSVGRISSFGERRLCREGLFSRSFFWPFFFFFAAFWPFSSTNAVLRCPQDVAENLFDLPEESSRSPVFPKMPPCTLEKRENRNNTQRRTHT